MDRTWTVVRFTAEDTVEALPTTWIFGNHCYWPPLTQQKMAIAIKNHESPNTCWPSYEISFFKNGTFDTYLEARQKCRRAECQSDLVSEEDDLKKRKMRNKKIIYSSSDSSNDGIIPDPPAKKISATSRNIAKKDDEQPGSIASSTSSSEDAVLKKLATDFETFCSQTLRKQNILTSILTDLVTEVKSLKETITEMKALRPSDSSNIRTESIFEKLKLPARTLEDFREIEEYLQPQENLTNVIQEVSKIGGNSPFEFIKRVMLQFMTYSTATLFTWYGKKGKLCFKDTKMSQVILGSSNSIGTNKQIEEALQKFFRRAKERSHNEKESLIPAASASN